VCHFFCSLRVSIKIFEGEGGQNSKMWKGQSQALKKKKKSTINGDKRTFQKKEERQKKDREGKIKRRRRRRRREEEEEKGKQTFSSDVSGEMKL